MYKQLTLEVHIKNIATLNWDNINILDIDILVGMHEEEHWKYSCYIRKGHRCGRVIWPDINVTWLPKENFFFLVKSLIKEYTQYDGLH